MTVNPYKRELQVARNLVTLRWASIAVIFSFCVAFIFGFKMSFQLEPIYIICCIMAVFNIYLTLHIAMLNCQLSVTRGLTTLKKTMYRVVSQFFSSFKTHGLKGLAGIPVVLIKISNLIYLMFLETLKEFPFNPMSLGNVMHMQILFDIVAVLALTRYTGSTESPMFFMAAIPIAVAGSVINAKAGILYSMIACVGWFFNSLLIRFGLIDHIKFYSPMYGDLHTCDGWIYSYSLVAALSFCAFAFISHKLTFAFKEKVEDLDKSLYISKSTSISLKHVALMQTDPWLVLDKTGKILDLKGDESQDLIKSDMIGKNILDCLGSLRKYNYEFVVQSVLSSHSYKKINDVKFCFKDKSEHIFDLIVSYYKEFDGKDRIMVSFNEKTIEVNRKELVDTLSAECMHARNSIEKLSSENKELRKSLDDVIKVSSDKSIDIEVLNTKVNDMDIETNNLNNKISDLMNQVAAVNSDNDQLRVQLENRQMILDDVADFIDSCNELDDLVNKVEHRTKDLFGLENTCFHVFDATDMLHQKNEILDMRKVSPRLLDIPRNHPETLDPALTEGRPVVFSAEFRPEKSSASIAITNGDLKRLVAFVPLKEDDKVLGMMMLEKYGASENTDRIVDMVSFYLKQVSGTIKTAIENRKIQNKNRELHEDIVKMHNRLDSIKSMILNDYSKDVRPFSGMLYEISKVVPLRDAMLVRIQSDGTTDCYSRINKSRPLEMSEFENKIVEQLKVNNENKVKFTSENGVDSFWAYPLVDKKRLLGVLFLYINDEAEEIDKVTIDFCVNILKNEFSLYVLNEEREIWESFYSNSMPA